MPTTICPGCDYEFSISRPRLGQKVRCPGCDAQLEVVYLDPLEVDWIEDEYEDWDEDEDE